VTANNESTSDGDIVTFKQFSEANPAWSEQSLRWLRFNQSSNGLEAAGAFIELPGSLKKSRVLIDKPRFFEWVRAGQRSRSA
jgi:hypothetical protein